MIPHDYQPSGHGYKVRLLLAQLGIPFRVVGVLRTSPVLTVPDFRMHAAARCAVSPP